MNERLQLLAEQAKDYADYYSMLSDSAEQEIFTEKFAELIIQECLNEIQLLLDCNTQVDEFEQGVYNGIDMAKDCIKEHFGVEE